MIRHQTEYDILQGALEAFHAETAMQLDVVAFDVRRDNHQIDAILKMPNNGTQLLAEIKKWAAHTNLGAVINQIQQLMAPEECILVADYINPNMGEKLKEAGIQHIDTVGNAYINQAPFYIYIKGNRLRTKANSNTKTGKAFQPAGMKIVFAFLKDRELVNAPYREIAEQAQVALGTVGRVISDLIAQGILVESIKNTQRQLADYERLLDKWVEAYPHQLRDKYHLGTYTTDFPDWWKTLDIAGFQAAWGGEIAAAEYTGYLNPKDAVVYIKKASMGNFLKEGRLKKVLATETPEIEIALIEPFWNQDDGTERRGLVHPLIVYADLVATGDPRNLDTAKRLREKYLR